MSKDDKAEASPDTPSHTPGIAEGNSPGSYEAMAGHKRDDRSSARRSTGIRPRKRNTVVKGSPNLSPA